MAIVAEILLEDHALPLVGLANSIPSGEIAVSDSVPLEDDRYLLTVSVDDESRDAFEREVDAQSEVVDTAEVGQTADGWFYQVTVDSGAELFASHDPEEFEGVLLDATVTGDGVRESKVFSDFEAFSTLRDRCEVHDIPFELLTIASDPENPGERDTFGLTERQHTALSLAFSRGYYDSPRGVTTQELADELGISAPSASDLLRRAERQLISQLFGSKRHLNGLTA
ncbi:helix-turn-helix domain-containing protein [Natrinema halophilum]|uniref:Helix-turn-helix domain-containing protein n=1 Tax=Natrinema halophilum TaxID=1699371 RepID=A0A7D5KQS7_9EURY|nr:helix-turn-helix domain-containing protein [Natrinema halophilum]QLG48657.1 helix-turn-helix domain-containing protein [Natrinema halophilum]